LARWRASRRETCITRLRPLLMWWTAPAPGIEVPWAITGVSGSASERVAVAPRFSLRFLAERRRWTRTRPRAPRWSPIRRPPRS
jgi:hypothetical protein